MSNLLFVGFLAKKVESKATVGRVSIRTHDIAITNEVKNIIIRYQYYGPSPQPSCHLSKSRLLYSFTLRSEEFETDGFEPIELIYRDPQEVILVGQLSRVISEGAAPAP